MKIINNTYKNKVEKPLLIIEIPQVNITKKVYYIDSNLNDINKNVKILPQSNLKDKFIILAAHSGTSSVAYFNKLENLSLNEQIYIYYKNKKNRFIVKKINYIEKTGYLKIEKKLKDTLVLITCSTKFHNKQIIVYAKKNDK